jgi:hypothetical protein
MASKLNGLTLDANIYPPDSTFTPSSGRVGESVSVGMDGLRIAVGNRFRYNNTNVVSGQGAAHFYDWNATTLTWDLVSALTLTNTSNTGTVYQNYANVCLDKLTNHYLVSYNVGDTATAGGVSRRFSSGVAAWGTKVSTVATANTSGGGFEQNASIHIDGLFLTVGRPSSTNTLYTGKVHIFKLSTWATTGNAVTNITTRYAGEATYTATIIIKSNVSAPGAPTTPGWGDSVHLNSTYKLLFIGAIRDQDAAFTVTPGAVYVYHYVENTATQWELTFLGKIVAPVRVDNEQFGVSITASDDGTLLFIGALNTDNGSSVTPGCIYTFRQDIDPTTQAFTSNWVYIEKLVDDRLDPNPSARFGASISMTSESTLAIGVLQGRTPTGFDTGFIKAYTPDIVPYVIETRTISKPISIETAAPTTVSKSIDIQTASQLSLSKAVDIYTSSPLSLSYPLTINTATVATISKSLEIVVASGTPNTVVISRQIEIRTAGDYTISYGISIETYAPISLTKQIEVKTATILTIAKSISIIDQISYVINKPVTIVNRSIYAIGKPIALNFTISPTTIGLNLRVLTTSPVVLFNPIAVIVSEPSVTIKKGIRIQNSKPKSLIKPVNINVSVLPLGAISEQGIGYTIINEQFRTREWSCSVMLGGIDTTLKITGEIKIDITPSAARVASFTIKPPEGNISTMTYSASPVEITYTQYNPVTHAVSAVYKLFSGIVDVPYFDVDTKLITLNCTDNVSRVVKDLLDSDINALVPNTVWSPLIYARFHHRWEYLLQRIETFPYIVFMDTDKVLRAKLNEVGTLNYEFQENVIVSNSLKVTIGSTKGLVNQVNCSFSISKDEYRETVKGLLWQGETAAPSGPACGLQMILDAVSGADASFVGEPTFDILGESRFITDASTGSTTAIVNSGTELIATGFKANIAKRMVQQVNTTFQFTVKGGRTSDYTGILQDEDSASITVIYKPKTTDWFLETTEVQENVSTCGRAGATLAMAGNALDSSSLPAVIDFDSDGGPIFSGGSSSGGGIAAVYIPYPEMPITYKIWKTATDKSPMPVALVDKWLSDEEFEDSEATSKVDTTNNLTRPNTPNAPGEHIFNLDSFIQSGTSAQLNEAYATIRARAATKVKTSHRSNLVEFTTAVSPFIVLGDTCRVNTAAVKATGVVNSITHVLSIASGSALSSFTLASSTDKPFEVAAGDEVGIAISKPIEISIGIIPPVQSYQGFKPIDVTDRPIPAIRGSADNPKEIVYTGITGNQFYKDIKDIDESWEGHIAPYGNGQGTNTFKLVFPPVPLEHTNAFTATVSQGTITVDVPNDEFILRG